MKPIVLFLALAATIANSEVLACEAEFSYYQLNGEVYFINESTPLDSSTLFYWEFGDGTTSTLSFPTHSFPQPGLFNVCLTITQLNGCTDYVCYPVQVDSTINLPDCSAAFYYESSNYQITFINVSSWQSGNPGFIWDFGDGSSSTEMSPMHTYSQAGTYVVCLTLTTDSGCTDSYCSTIAVLDSSCSAAFSYQINANEVQFEANNGNSPGGYFWDFGDGQTSTETNPLHSYDQPGVYYACLWYTDSLCSAFNCDTIIVTEGNDCNAAFTFSLFDNSASFYPALQDPDKLYSWNFGDGSESSMISPTHEYTEPGNYEVCLTISDDSCSETVCQTLVLIADSSNNGSDCEASFEITGVDSASSTIWVTELSTGGISYHWDFGDGTTSDEQNPTHDYAQNGPYYLCLTITCDSSMTSTYCEWIGFGDSLLNEGVRSGFTLNIISLNTSGIAQAAPKGNLIFFPNPASDKVSFSIPGEVIGETRVSVKNGMGQVVIEKVVSAGNFKRMEIDLGTLSPGFYVVYVSTPEKLFSGSLMKQ